MISNKIELKSLRGKVLGILSLMMGVSLLGVGASFFLTQRVNHRLNEINFRMVPMQKELTQISSDTELLKREVERSFSSVHWKDPRWKPRKLSAWVVDAQVTSLLRFQSLVKPYAASESAHLLWPDWLIRLKSLNQQVQNVSAELYVTLDQAKKSEPTIESAVMDAETLLPRLNASVQLMQKEVDWARRQVDQESRAVFLSAQSEVKNLRMSLQLLLLLVIAVSLLMVWMGERALRPIGDLRRIVNSITKRGEVRDSDKIEMSEVSILKNDEVSDLAREFHQMAVALLERDKTVQAQKERLSEQNRKLLQAEHFAAVGRLSSQVAHEVGNPLHSIGLEAELGLVLLERFRLNGDPTINPELSPEFNPAFSREVIALKQSMSTIVDRVDRLQKIIQNYLKLSKPVPDAMLPVSFLDVVESVIATYATSIESLGVKLNWRFDDSSLRQSFMVRGDFELLEHALGNLMKNSLQAIESRQLAENAVTYKPRIDIDVKPVFGNSQSMNRLKFQFSDNGPGLSQDAQENCFKPFFTTKAQGTGLGLSFVKKVFEDLGGTFSLGTTAAGIGTVFVGALPLSEPHPPAFTGVMRTLE